MPAPTTAVRELARARFAEDLAAGRVPPLPTEAQQRLRILLAGARRRPTVRSGRAA